MIEKYIYVSILSTCQPSDSMIFKGRGEMFRVILWISIAIFGALMGIFVGLLVYLTRDLPEVRKLEDFSPSAVTRILAADGSTIAEYYAERREPVPIDKIPSYLKEAVLAVEDDGFYEHFGIRPKAILRAAIQDILHGRYVQGGSTITQQLARVMFLTPDKSLRRKLKEALLALQIERMYTKDKILEFYLNQIYLGSGAYGVQAAAKIYFGKNVWELGLAECALLAGLPKWPSRYSPLVDPIMARKRRHLVLKRMVDLGYISPEEAAKAGSAPVPKTMHTLELRRNLSSCAYFADQVRAVLEEKLGPGALYRQGLTVKTTLMPDLQRAAEKAVRYELARLERRHPEIYLRPGATRPQAALLALDVRTGAVLAMVGGRDYVESQFNRAVSALRQPGSAFKPIIYASAISAGFSQAYTVLDAPIRLPGSKKGVYWQPGNFGGKYEGVVTIRKALEKSLNTATVRLLQKIGVDRAIGMARAMGIRSHLKKDLTLALGSSEVTLLELTAAYSVFANKGIYFQPVFYTEVIAPDGEVVLRPEQIKREVLDAQTAFIVTDMLKGVIKNGTGWRASQLGRPAAGKTGTTDDYRDAWFVGFTPELICGVWVGKDDHSSLGAMETGSRAAVPIWVRFMKEALKDMPARDFEVPPGVLFVSVDENTGHLVSGKGRGSRVALTESERSALISEREGQFQFF